MRTKPAYSQCKIYVDGCPELEVGDYMFTRGGSGYRVQSIRQDGKRAQRRHLTCLRWPIDEIPPDARVWEFTWYARKKKRATTLGDMAARATA